MIDIAWNSGGSIAGEDYMMQLSFYNAMLVAYVPRIAREVQKSAKY